MAQPVKCSLPLGRGCVQQYMSVIQNWGEGGRDRRVAGALSSRFSERLLQRVRWRRRHWTWQLWGIWGGGGSNVLRKFPQLVSNTDKTMPPGECHLEPKLKFEHVSECVHPSEWTRTGQFQPQFVYHDLGLLA